MVPTLLRHVPKQSRFLITQFRNFSTTPNNGGVEPRPGPPPIKVAVTESSGRGVFAIRSIGAGELIHTAKPFISHPSLSTLHSVCYFCLRRLKHQNPNEGFPAQCPRFCSDQCTQQAKVFYEVENKVDWSAYHDYCRNNALKYPLLVKRMACMVISGSRPVDCLDILQPASLPLEAILKMEEEFDLLNNAFREANICNESLKFLTKEWYVGILARIRINAFRIELVPSSFDDFLSMTAAGTDAAVGNAVYVLASFYNHDCDPNAHILWIDNANAKLKALRDIEEGEELRICYIDASMDLNARQSILSQGFGFICSCPRCLSGE